MRGRLTLMAVLAVCLGSVILAHPALAAPRHAAHAAQAAHARTQPWPVTISVRTVPALAGVQFSFDGMPIITGADGTTSFTEHHNFFLHTLTLLNTKPNRGDRRYSFARWAGQRDPDQAFQPTVRGLPMRANYTVTASFGARCPVTPRFTYQQGHRLDPGRISTVTVRSSTGRVATLRPAGRTWLQCQLPLYRGSTLVSHPVRYAIQSVMVSGANVVHAGVRQFNPGSNPKPTIVGYFHDLTIRAHDALYGRATGAEALVTLQGGSVRQVPLRAGHTVTLIALPQGSYKVAVKSGGGIISAQSIRLSRNEVVDLTVVTPVDLATVGAAVVVVLFGLPLLAGSRRRRLLGLLRNSRTEWRLRLRRWLRREPT